MIKKLLILLFVLNLSASIAYADWTLPEVVGMAKNNNPEILAAKNRWQSSRAEVAKNYFLVDPKFGIEYEKIPSPSFSPTNATMKKLTFSQDIPFPAKLYYEGLAASSRADMYYQQYIGTERVIIKDLKKAYYNIYKIDKMIDLLKVDIGFLRQIFEVSKSNYIIGKRRQSDVIKIQVELSKMENELTNIRNERFVFQKQIYLLLNSTQEVDIAAPDIKLIDFMIDYVKARDIAINNSTRILEEKAAENEASAMKSLGYLSYAPDIMAKFKKQEFGDMPGSRDIMLEATIPLWFPIRQRSIVSSSSLQYEFQKAKVDYVKNQVAFDSKDLTTNINNLSRTSRLYKNNFIPSYSGLIASSIAGYSSGKVDFIDILDSQRSYVQLNTEYYNYVAQLYTKLAELEEIIGENAMNEVIVK